MESKNLLSKEMAEAKERASEELRMADREFAAIPGGGSEEVEVRLASCRLSEGRRVKRIGGSRPRIAN